MTGLPNQGMVTILRVSRLSANDTDARLVDRTVEDGEVVVKGKTVAVLEGSKVAEELEAPSDGVLYWLAQRNATLPVGTPIAVLCPPGTARPDALALARETVPTTSETAVVAVDGAFFSRKAKALIAAHAISPEMFRGRGLITAPMVAAEVKRAGAAIGPMIRQSQFARPPRLGENGRVVVVGAGPGAGQILSVLLAERGTVVIGLLDDAPDRQSREVFGVGVLGTVAYLETLAAAGAVDSAIVASPNWPDLNRRVEEIADRCGLQLANAIHPTANFDLGVTIGRGCHIGPFCHLGAETTLGDHCFLSSRTTFEHHNRVGAFVTTGPNVATSGQVAVGDGVHFGTGVVVEPGLVIGHGATLASGTSITANVPPGAVVKGRTFRAQDFKDTGE